MPDNTPRAIAKLARDTAALVEIAPPRRPHSQCGADGRCFMLAVAAITACSSACERLRKQPGPGGPRCADGSVTQHQDSQIPGPVQPWPPVGALIAA